MSGSPQQLRSLPDWVFDIEERDDFGDESLPIFDEANIHQVMTMLRWIAILPREIIMCQSLGAMSRRVPLQGMQQELNGPLFIMGLFVVVVWMGRVSDATWILFIWSCGAITSHLVARVAVQKSTLRAHLSILGYGVTPQVPVAFVIIVVDPKNWVKLLLEFVAVVWGTLAVHLSQRAMFPLATTSTLPSRMPRPVTGTKSPRHEGEGQGHGATAEELGGVGKTHLWLLFFPALLMNIYLISLL